MGVITTFAAARMGLQLVLLVLVFLSSSPSSSSSSSTSFRRRQQQQHTVMGFMPLSLSQSPPPPRRRRHNIPCYYYGQSLSQSSARTPTTSELSSSLQRHHFSAFTSTSTSTTTPTSRLRRSRTRRQTWSSSTATTTSTSTSTGTQLEMSGQGVAPTKNYRWYEEAFELEVTVKVPKDTRAKDIQFKATSTSIDLKLVNNNNNKNNNNNSEGQKEPQAEAQEEEEEGVVTLLDPDRPLRGKVNVEGTFWSISDPDEKQRSDDDTLNSSGGGGDDNNTDEYREVTVTIEKQIRTPKDDFDMIEYDWKGLYNDDADEVSYRHYDEPEELDVREYAAGLGVDIDSIDMNLVDKSMFSSGLNNNKAKTANIKNSDGGEDSDNSESSSSSSSSSSQAPPTSPFEALKDSGLMKEVTQQADGTEWTTDEDGERVPFSSMGRQNDLLSKMDTLDVISDDDVESPIAAGDAIGDVDDQINEMVSSEDDSDDSDGEDRPQNPFASADSPCSKTVPVDDVETFDEENLDQVQSSSESSEPEFESVSKQSPSTTTIGQPRNDGINIDPIAELTVAKLKDILRSRGLKVSGNKKELQDRLRNEVQAMVADNSNDVPTSEKE